MSRECPSPSPLLWGSQHKGVWAPKEAKCHPLARAVLRDSVLSYLWGRAAKSEDSSLQTGNWVTQTKWMGFEYKMGERQHVGEARREGPDENARQQTEPSQFTRWHSLTVPGACSPLSQREAHFHKARPDGIGLCPGMGRAEDEETSREEAKRDALKKSLLQEDLMTEAKKAFPTRMALQGLRLGSSLPGKGSYLVSSPSTPCPGTCNSETIRQRIIPASFKSCCKMCFACGCSSSNKG
ncbi:uncharacterized protein LOC126048387 isoform X2 [Accipiter gentilis]|uniref:uncharacterized protein LOC126048387 isoform X2 n=1 Tax=Astur gentilis TaxID=8957 RepID=UPI00211073E4|nr:uncharacterized protein LOC126048387 isoform X2 [Accipiter gentilis]